MNSNIGDRIREALVMRDWKQADLIRACDKNTLGITITSKDLYKYIHCGSIPSADRLQIIADALGVEKLWLLGYETSEGITREEHLLIAAWRNATDEEKENVAFILRNRGMAFETRQSLKEQAG